MSVEHDVVKFLFVPVLVDICIRVPNCAHSCAYTIPSSSLSSSYNSGAAGVCRKLAEGTHSCWSRRHSKLGQRGDSLKI